MYIRGMATVRVTDARAQFPGLLSTAQTEAVFLERRGKLEAGAEDIAAIEEALAEPGENIPWEQVIAELGWG